MSKTEASLWEDVRRLCLDPSRREYDVTEVSDALMRIMVEIGDDKLPDHLAAAVEEGIFTYDEGALLIGVAGYSTDDEGHRIQLVLEHWLETNADEMRIGMALDQDTVPFRSSKRRAEVLTAIALRFPKYADKCKYLIETYRNV